MQLRMVLGFIGQLIAIPAALFLVPTTYPKLFSTAGTMDSAGASAEEDVAIMSSEDAISVQGRLGDINAAGAGGEAAAASDGDAGHKKTSKKSKKSKKKKARRGASKGKGLFRRRQEGGRTAGRDADHASARGGTGFGDGGDGDDGGRGGERGAGGMEAFLKGLEEAAAGVREALATIAHPLHELPRKAGGVFSTIVLKRGDKQVEANPPVPDSTAKYLAELQLAQESAERALDTPGWEEVAQRSGVTVWKKYFPKDEYGYRYPCVKARGIIDGSAADVMGMIVDSTRVLEYNRYSRGRTDIEHLGPHTKIVWNKAQPPLSKKLHDFCTLMHMQPLDDEEGSFMLITRATEHPKAPLLDGHVRSEILLGVTILRPAGGDPNRTEMTTVNHIVSNGVPVMIADRVSTKNAIDFIQNVEIAALAAAAAAAGAPPPEEGFGVGSVVGGPGGLGEGDGSLPAGAGLVPAAAAV